MLNQEANFISLDGEVQGLLPSFYQDYSSLLPDPCNYTRYLPFTLWRKRAQVLHLDEDTVLVQLLGKVGLHFYNLQKGTNLQFLALHKHENYAKSSYLVALKADDPIRNSPSREFETNVRYAFDGNKNSFNVITTSCGIKPQTLVKGGDFNELAVDDLFKGPLPDFLPENAYYYKMRESDVEEHKEWLNLYVELELVSKWEFKPEEMDYVKPFQLTTILVQTGENVEGKKKVIAENAIFYICFSTKGGEFRRGLEFTGILRRRTMDGMPEHYSLEVKCLYLEQ